MTSVDQLRSSTQILLPEEAVQDLREDLQSRFTVTLHTEGEGVRIIGSPVVIKDVNRFLTRNGVAVP